jgi:hypothetical protein
MALEAIAATRADVFSLADIRDTPLLLHALAHQNARRPSFAAQKFAATSLSSAKGEDIHRLLVLIN